MSKQSNSTDFGNNELDIYKMDTDAYELDVVSNTFEEIKFGIKVKKGVTNLSNFKVDGKEPDENGYWVMNESKEDCRISYDFELENGMKVRKESRQWIGPMEIINEDASGAPIIMQADTFSFYIKSLISIDSVYIIVNGVKYDSCTIFNRGNNEYKFFFLDDVLYILQSQYSMLIESTIMSNGEIGKDECNRIINQLFDSDITVVINNVLSIKLHPYENTDILNYENFIFFFNIDMEVIYE